VTLLVNHAAPFAAIPEPPRGFEADLIAILAGAIPAEPGRRSEAASQQFLDRLLACWQVIPAITDRQLAALRQMLAPAHAERLANVRLALIGFMRVQQVAARRLVQAMEADGLEYCLLKGSATAQIAYPEPWMRGAWDLDIGVRRHDLARAERIAEACGYCPAQQDIATGGFVRANPALKAKVESGHYELGFLVRRLQVGNLGEESLRAIRSEPFAAAYWFDVADARPCCYAAVDVHHAISHDIPLDDLLDTRRRLETAAGSSHVPSTAWIVAHLVFKLYWEGVHHYGKMLYEYADLVRLMPLLDAATVAQVTAILDRYELTAAGYYVFRRLPEFGIAPAGHILDFLAASGAIEAHGDPIQCNDLGDMWPKLWGRR
jgi:hypothetical protein